MRKLRIAQIGVNTNSHSVQIFGSIAKQSDLFEIAGYCLPEGEKERLPWRAAKLSGYPELTLEEILNDPSIEAVTVETDEVYCTKYALMAARHGKHVHMEKPGGVDPGEFAELIAEVKKQGKVFHIGYMYRYNPAVRRLLERVHAGELGEIVHVEAQMNCSHPAEVRDWLGTLPGGMMFFLAAIWWTLCCSCRESRTRSFR